MNKVSKRRASAPAFVSEKQLVLVGFESPFSQKLDASNRWVKLSAQIPWDELCNMYLKIVGIKETGRPPISPRVIIGSLMIKHICHLDDRETVDQISENMYMQYFLGYQSFSNEVPFDASLFVEFRKRMGMEQINEMNDKIHAMYLSRQQSLENQDSKTVNKKKDNDGQPPESETNIIHKGRVLMDATACPQNIAFPTDLNLLSDAREKSEELIDLLYQETLHQTKPRTYRKEARKEYLRIAQKRKKGRMEIRKGIRKQLSYLKRNLNHIDLLLDKYTVFPLKAKQQRYLWVIHTLYQQQKQMYDAHNHTVIDRIVSIHQPHVRPIVRGKSTAKTEFGAKINVSLVDGFSFLDELSWDAFNEGSHMKDYVQQYKKRFGYYPKEILADQIYCTRANRIHLKELGIKLLAKSLGRPSAMKEHVRPGERNPIEAKFGQAKTGYGLDNVKARLKQTSESWIACIFLVLNLVNLARQALLCLIWSFSALSMKNEHWLGSVKKDINHFIVPILFGNSQMISKIRVC